MTIRKTPALARLALATLSPPSYFCHRFALQSPPTHFQPMPCTPPLPGY